MSRLELRIRMILRRFGQEWFGWSVRSRSLARRCWIYCVHSRTVTGSLEQLLFFTTSSQISRGAFLLTRFIAKLFAEITNQWFNTESCNEPCLPTHFHKHAPQCFARWWGKRTWKWGVEWFNNEESNWRSSTLHSRENHNRLDALLG